MTTATATPEAGTTLLPKHLADLRASGLSDETVEASGVYSMKDPEQIRHTLNWRGRAAARKLGPCLAFQYRNLDGSFNGHTRLKPDNPRTETRDGKTRVIKYEQPVGEALQSYFTVAAVEAARESAAVLGFGEGEKKVLAMAQAGIPCIGLPGVWAWPEPAKKTKGKPAGDRMLRKALQAIQWVGRPVPIIFDTDSRRNSTVNHARAELARVLSLLGAIPYLIDLPPGPRGGDGRHEKMGADDFIVAHGEAAFRRLVERAMEGRPESNLLWA